DRHRSKNRFPPAARRRTALPAKSLKWPSRAHARLNDADVPSPSSARAAPKFSVPQTWLKAGEINHEEHEGHEEICRSENEATLPIFPVMRQFSQWLLVAMLAATACGQRLTPTVSEFSAQRQRMVERQLKARDIKDER